MGPASRQDWGDEHPVTVGPVPPSGVREALGLALQRLGSAEREERAAMLVERGDASAAGPRGLLVARRGRCPVGAVLAQPMAGRTALVWPPGLRPGEPRGTAVRLLRRACDWLAEAGVLEAHVLLESVSAADQAVLAGCGFGYLTELAYLGSTEAEFPAADPGGPLQFEPFRLGERRRLAALVEATYEGTQDCPELEGVREVDDVLAGYRATGQFSPSRWLLVRHGGRDVGCLLLADHPQHGNLELVYMGLIRPARGRGWGYHVARRAQWVARSAGRQRVVLAVDVRNGPARAVYRRAGFRRWASRQVFWRRFSPAG